MFLNQWYGIFKKNQYTSSIVMVELKCAFKHFDNLNKFIWYMYLSSVSDGAIHKLNFKIFENPSSSITDGVMYKTVLSIEKKI